MQFNSWVGSDGSRASLPVVRCPRATTGEQVYLEDVQTDEDKINSSLLSSESTFLPFTSDLDPQTAHTDSEDETETFEADSLAPNRPSQPRNPNPKKAEGSPPAEKRHRKTGEENVPSTTAASLVANPKSATEMPFDLGEPEFKNAAKEAQANPSVGKFNLLEADKAAIRIQSWWRGHYIRCGHPAAKEVRGEIRLRRMQEHIVFLSDKLET